MVTPVGVSALMMAWSTMSAPKPDRGVCHSALRLQPDARPPRTPVSASLLPNQVFQSWSAILVQIQLDRQDRTLMVIPFDRVTLSQIFAAQLLDSSSPMVEDRKSGQAANHVGSSPWGDVSLWLHSVGPYLFCSCATPGKNCPRFENHLAIAKPPNMFGLLCYIHPSVPSN
jgi:hypothetical protein